MHVWLNKGITSGEMLDGRDEAMVVDLVVADWQLSIDSSAVVI